jgi:hypothetical protein
MRVKIKLYLFFGFLYLFAAFFSAGLFFTYDIEIAPLIFKQADEVLSFARFASLCYRFLCPLVLMGIAAFTLYSCAVSGFSCLYCGALMGQLTMTYCLSGMNPFTHGAVFIFLLGFGALFVSLSYLTSRFRNRLKTAAPDPKSLIRETSTHAFLMSLLSICLIEIFLSASLYFLIHFFPL